MATLDEIRQQLISAGKGDPLPAIMLIEAREALIRAFEIPREYFTETPKEFQRRWRRDGVQLACLIERLERANK